MNLTAVREPSFSCQEFSIFVSQPTVIRCDILLMLSEIIVTLEIYNQLSVALTMNIFLFLWTTILHVQSLCTIVSGEAGNMRIYIFEMPFSMALNTHCS